jgi:hypothetical protein
MKIKPPWLTIESRRFTVGKKFEDRFCFDLVFRHSLKTISLSASRVVNRNPALGLIG